MERSRQQAVSVWHVLEGPQKVEVLWTQSAFVEQAVLHPEPETQAKGEQLVSCLVPQVPDPSQVAADWVLPLQVTDPQYVPELLGCLVGQAPEVPEQTAASRQSLSALQVVLVL